MKKIISVAVCLLMILSLCSCRGNVNGVKIIEVESELYSQEDIDDAIQTVKNEFRKSWPGCWLTEISYAGDERTTDETEYYLDGNFCEGDELIVLTSSYYVGIFGGDGSLEQCSTYEDWSWILVRENGGMWTLITGGYG